ncbi:MAG TPA: hypothetical protein VME41_13950 [Stellaceae bacterium]|nr:hypothetical protein [Stellaceae bacterium]
MASVLAVAHIAAARAAANLDLKSLTKTVVELYAANAAGNGPDLKRPIGAGFLLEIPLLANPNQSYKALVTARHVVDPAWAKCPSATDPAVVYARVNKRSYDPTSGISGIDFIRIELQEKGKPNWWHFHDDDVDAAVLPVQVDYSIYDVNAVHVALFPTDQDMAVLEPADPVLSVGLLPEETTRNYPIVQVGAVASIPLEDIETRCTVDSPVILLKEWLIAAGLAPANGGAPIFNMPSGGPNGGARQPRPLILGLQAMPYPGSDIVGMTPIGYVYQILQALKLAGANLQRGSP